MNEEKKINQEWENFKKSKTGVDQQAALDQSWKNYSTAPKKLKIITEEQALEIVKDKSKIIREGTGEKTLREQLPDAVFKGAPSNAPRFFKVQIDYSIRLITEHEAHVTNRGFSLTVPPLIPGRYPRGLEIAVFEMKPNEIKSVILPPELGFGNQEIPGIPPYSTVEFEIELVNYICMRTGG